MPLKLCSTAYLLLCPALFIQGHCEQQGLQKVHLSQHLVTLTKAAQFLAPVCSSHVHLPTCASLPCAAILEEWRGTLQLHHPRWQLLAVCGY